MMKLKIITIALLIILFSIPSFAHSGGTDSSGGHYDSSNGEYHYHHGYSAHDHYDMDGDGDDDCPKTFKKPNGWNTSTAQETEEVSVSDVLCNIGVVLLCIGLLVVAVRHIMIEMRMR